MEFPLFEYGTRDKIVEMQFELLRSQLSYVSNNSPYYKRVFDEIQFDPAELSTNFNISELPFTTKTQFAEYNSEFISIETSNIADLVTTSGTLGKPVSYAISQNDLKRLGANEALSFLCAGIKPGETIVLMTTIDKRFMAGLAYMLGAQMLGCPLVRTGPGVPSMQWDSIHRFKADHIIAVPSFIPRLLDYAGENGIDPNQSNVKSVICIGEPVRNDAFELNALGSRIKSQWDVQLYSTYASTEMAAAFTECEAQCGGHLRPDLILLEVLDEYNNQVSNGQYGEVVITTLGVEGTPLVRYRTGDICTYHDQECACGRSTPRLGPVLGRKEHMIKFKGTTIYPPQLYNVLATFPEVGEYLIQVRSDEYGGDLIEVLVSDEWVDQPLAQELRHAFRSTLRVSPEIVFKPLTEIIELKQGSVQRKPIKFIDLRHK